MKASGSLLCEGIIDGQDGANGYNSVAVPMYRRSATALGNGDKPTGTLTYTFSTGRVTGASSYFNGWSQTIPETVAGTKLYIIMALARSQSDTDEIAKTDWSTPVEYVADGMNSAAVTIYKRAASVPNDKPADNAVYTFATGKLTGTLNGWSTDIPATDSNHHPCWVRHAMAVSTGSNDTILAEEWSNPATKLVEDGAKGDPGGNTATIFLYRRSATAVTSVGTLPTLYYKFSTKRLYTDEACTTLFSGQNGWYQDIPSGSNPIYVTTAVAYSTTNVDTIGNTEWVSPIQFTENGEHGVNTAPIFLYKRSATAITAHGITKSLYYKFDDGVLYKEAAATNVATDSDLNNWSRFVPSGNDPCYIIQASALSQSDTDEIAKTDWSTPVKYVEDGDDAETYTISLAGSSFYRDPNTETIYVNIKGKVLKTVGGTTTEYTDLSRSDLSMYFRKTDGTTDAVPNNDSLTNGFTVSGSTFASKYYNATGYSDEEVFVVEFKGKWSASIQIEKYGTNGVRGATGRMYYLAGEFPKNAPYTRTSALCPVVYYGTEWWYVAVDGTVDSSDVPSDSSKKWAKLENYGVVITDAIFVKQFAQFGAAIITGDWLISCHGKIGTTQYGGTVEEPDYYDGRAAYTYFDPAYPDGYEPFTLPIVASEVDKAYTTQWTKITNDFKLTAGTYKFKIRCYVNTSDTVHIRFFQGDNTEDAYYIGGTTSDTAVTLEKTITIGSNRSDWNLRAATNEDGEIGYIQSIEIEPIDARFVPNYAVDLKTGRTYQSDAHIKGTITSVGENTKIVIEDGVIKFFGMWNFPNIVLGVSDDGGAVLNIYDKNGNFKYGLGPNEIIYTKSQAESMTLRYYNIYTGATDCTSLTDSDIVAIYRFVYKNVNPDYTTSLYKYLAKISSNVYGGSHVNNDDAQGKKFNEKIIKQGYSTPLVDGDIYGGGLVMSSNKPMSGIIKYLSNMLSGTSVDELDYRGYNIMQDSDFNMTKDGQIYRYYTKGYSPVEAFYIDFSTLSSGAIGYNSSYAGSWYLNLCTDPADDETLLDPLYYFNLMCIDNSGRSLGIKTLYINKSKLKTILGTAGYSL